MDKLTDRTRQLMAERFGHDNVIALATLDGGFPAVRYVNAYFEDGSFYVVTWGGSNKLRQLRENPNASLAGEWFAAHCLGEDLGAFGETKNAAPAAKLRRVFSAWIDNGHSDLASPETSSL